MAIKIGGIDLGTSIINLEYQVLRTQKILEWILNNNPTLANPDKTALEQIDKSTVEELQKKFPDAGIKQTK